MYAFFYVEFCQDYGKSWKYGHLSAAQTLSGAEKYFAKKNKAVIDSSSQLINLEFSTSNRNDNSDDNLDRFVSESRINDKNEYDSDGSSNDESNENESNNKEKFIAMRRDRKALAKSIKNEGLMSIDEMNKSTNDFDDDESDLVSSGDDINHDRDNENFHVEQFEDDDDIDTHIAGTIIFLCHPCTFSPCTLSPLHTLFFVQIFRYWI